MIRTYKIFKPVESKEKLVSIFDTMFSAVEYIKRQIGLIKFQKCNQQDIYDGFGLIACEFYLNNELIYIIRKEVKYDL